MLLYLADYLSQYHSGFNVFQYLTLRAILGVLTALLISFLVGPEMIRRLGRYQIGQPVRDDGPQTHLVKAGTPTMGGALLLVAILASCLLWGDLGNAYLWIALLVTAVFGAVGWVDDYRKVVERDSRGLPAVKNVSLEVKAGEIVGVAGVAGNGQTELIEVLTGLRRASAGTVALAGIDVTNRSPRAVRDLGVAHRHRTHDGAAAFPPIDQTGLFQMC